MEMIWLLVGVLSHWWNLEKEFYALFTLRGFFLAARNSRPVEIQTFPLRDCTQKTNGKWMRDVKCVHTCEKFAIFLAARKIHTSVNRALGWLALRLILDAEPKGLKEDGINISCYLVVLTLCVRLNPSSCSLTLNVLVIKDVGDAACLDSRPMNLLQPMQFPTKCRLCLRRFFRGRGWGTNWTLRFIAKRYIDTANLYIGIFPVNFIYIVLSPELSNKLPVLSCCPFSDFQSIS